MPDAYHFALAAQSEKTGRTGLDPHLSNILPFRGQA